MLHTTEAFYKTKEYKNTLKINVKLFYYILVFGHPTPQQLEFSDYFFEVAWNSIRRTVDEFLLIYIVYFNTILETFNCLNRWVIKFQTSGHVFRVFIQIYSI